MPAIIQDKVYETDDNNESLDNIEELKKDPFDKVNKLNTLIYCKYSTKTIKISNKWEE